MSFQEQLNVKLARAIYASAAPLNMVENKFWVKFFASMRPSYKLPSRHTMSNALLEQVYVQTSIKVQELVAGASSVAIILDGWSNIRLVFHSIYWILGEVTLLLGIYVANTLVIKYSISKLL
jgi:hypothetical protein